MTRTLRPHGSLAEAQHGPDLRSYDTILVAYSGGKDATACLLTLLELGVPPSRIELHHHDVDGAGPPFVEWPSGSHYRRGPATTPTEIRRSCST